MTWLGGGLRPGLGGFGATGRHWGEGGMGEGLPASPEGARSHGA